MRSPHTIGDELPLPGTVTLHALVFGDHLSTYWPAGTRPCPDGPRHRVQYFAPSPSTSIRRTSSAARSTRLTPPTESVSLRANTPQKSQARHFMRRSYMETAACTPERPTY